MKIDFTLIVIILGSIIGLIGSCCMVYEAYNDIKKNKQKQVSIC